MNYKPIVHGAGVVLKSHDIGHNPSIMDIWNSVEWRTHDKQEIKATAELCRDEDAVRMYPSLITCPYAGHTILAEFGLLLLRRAGDKFRDIWRNKLCLPEKGQIESFQGKLRNPEIRAKAKGYRDIIEGYIAACDRYVALNLTNALHAHNIPFADSHGVDIYVWGPTNEYANRRRYHSLVPLTSVYASREQNENFGSAFADLLMEDLGSVREKSVGKQMKEIILRVVDGAARTTQTRSSAEPGQ